MRHVITALALMAGSAEAAEISTRTIPELGFAAYVLSGEIGRDDSARGIAKIEQILATEKTARKFLVLDSVGGSLDDALILGRYLKLRGFGTVVLPNGRCASACADLFFSGYDTALKRPKRIAFPGALVGVHQAYLQFDGKDTRKKSLDDIKAIYANLQWRIGQRLDYLIEMGTSTGVIALILSTRPDQISPVPQEALRDSGVILPVKVGGQWTVDPAFAAFGLFAAAPPPGAAALPATDQSRLTNPPKPPAPQ